MGRSCVGIDPVEIDGPARFAKKAVGHPSGMHVEHIDPNLTAYDCGEGSEGCQRCVRILDIGRVPKNGAQNPLLAELEGVFLPFGHAASSMVRLFALVELREFGHHVGHSSIREDVIDEVVNFDQACPILARVLPRSLQKLDER